MPPCGDSTSVAHPIAPRIGRSPDRRSPVGLGEETAACCLCLDDFSRPDNAAQKFVRARRNDGSPNRISLERHSLLTERTQRSA